MPQHTAGISQRKKPHSIAMRRWIRQICIMKRASVTDLRNSFPRLSGWIEAGEEVEITKRGKVFARLVPARRRETSNHIKPDILSRLQKTWGKRLFSSAEIGALREAELTGEQG